MSNNEDEANRLQSIAKELNDNVERLNEESAIHFEQTQRVSRLNRRLIIATAIGLVLDITLTILLGIGFQQVRNNDARITDVTNRLDFSQTTVRREVLCPVYKILIGAKSDKGASNFPAGIAAYNAFYNQLEQSYKALNCNK